MAASTALRKYGAASRLTRSGEVSKASLMRLRNFARMMQPPRQIVARSPGVTFQPYSALPAWI